MSAKCLDNVSEVSRRSFYGFSCSGKSPGYGTPGPRRSPLQERVAPPVKTVCLPFHAIFGMWHVRCDTRPLSQSPRVTFAAHRVHLRSSVVRRVDYLAEHAAFGGLEFSLANDARAPGWSRWRGGHAGLARSPSGSALRSRGRHGRLPRLPARLRSGLFATALLPRTRGLEARTAPGLIFLGVLARRQSALESRRNGWFPYRSTCTTSPTGRRVVGP